MGGCGFIGLSSCPNAPPLPAPPPPPPIQYCPPCPPNNQRILIIYKVSAAECCEPCADGMYSGDGISCACCMPGFWGKGQDGCIAIQAGTIVVCFYLPLFSC